MFKLVKKGSDLLNDTYGVYNLNRVTEDWIHIKNNVKI